MIMSKMWRFSLFRIPFAASIWFVFLLLLVGIPNLQPLLTRPAFAIVMCLGTMVIYALVFIVHELGHALMYRRFHHSPTVYLWGLGGVTHGDGPLRPWRNIAVAIAGTLSCMIVLWLPAEVLRRTVLPAVAEQDSVTYFIALLLILLQYWAWTWTWINLLPIIPNSGGRILEAVLELVTGEPRKQTARLISAVVAFGFAFVGFFVYGLTLALFLGLFLGAHNYIRYRHENDPSFPNYALVPEEDLGGGYGGGYDDYEPNIVSMESARKKRDRRSPADLIASGYSALERRDYVGAARMAEKLGDKRLNAAQAVEAISIAAWAWLGQRNPVKAEEALAELPRNTQPEPPLAAVLALSNKQIDHAVELMTRTLISEPDTPSKLIAVDLFAEFGMTHRLARQLVDLPNGAGFEAAVALEGLLHQLHRTQDASTVNDVILLG